jgi:pyrimidine-specific ribonucleoside hydrolase
VLVAVLALVSSAASAQPTEPIPVWIDVDPSAAGGYCLVINDEGLALAQAFHSPELDVRGVSATFGNAGIDETLRIARDVMERFGPAGMVVHRGAESGDELGRATDASRALASALRAAPLTILALGPVTTVATVVRNHPELVDRIDRVVAVAGRRPGQRFVAETTRSEPLMDLNFELDVSAFQLLLDAEVEIVLAPFEISSKVVLTQADMDRLAQGGEATRWLAGPASGWLEWWESRFGVEGFYPFDTLAVAYLTSPAWLTCDDLPAAIQTAPDDVKVPSMGEAAPDKPVSSSPKRWRRRAEFATATTSPRPSRPICWRGWSGRSEAGRSGIIPASAPAHRARHKTPFDDAKPE